MDFMSPKIPDMTGHICPATRGYSYGRVVVNLGFNT